MTFYYTVPQDSIKSLKAMGLHNKLNSAKIYSSKVWFQIKMGSVLSTDSHIDQTQSGGHMVRHGEFYSC